MFARSRVGRIPVGVIDARTRSRISERVSNWEQAVIFENLRLRSLLLAAVLLCGAVVVRGQQTGETAASSTSSTQQLSGGSTAGTSAQSVPSALVPGVLPLSLQDAIDRGLKQNLGPLFSAANITAAQGQHLEQLSALLPNVTAAPYLASSEINLAELGISGSLSVLSQLPGLGGRAPSVSVGPFNYFDAKVSVEQSLFNWKAINGNRASNQSVKSAQYTYQDARDVVVLAVGVMPVANTCRRSAH